MKSKQLLWICALLAGAVHADEGLFGNLKGAETLPKGAMGLIQHVNQRSDKGQGRYEAYDTKTELEYGLTHRLTGAVYLKGLAIDTAGLEIDGYLPGANQVGLRAAGVEGSLKYNFLSPAKDDIGLAGYLSGSYSWLDPHSGRDKDKYTVEAELLMQKYFLDGELIWVGNLGLESTYAQRAEIADLPPGFDWPTHPEMEIGIKLGTGLSYRFAPNWFVGAEIVYETEYETEVGQERWSMQAGPSIHYGGKDWWATVSYLPQLRGGGEQYAGQTDLNLHLIERTKQEVRVKVGFNF